MNINLTYDSSVSSAPAAFKTAMNYVVNFLDVTFTNSVTLNLNVGWGEVAGQALGSGALGESLSNEASTYTYGQVRNALIVNTAKSPTDVASVASLSTSDPTNGGTFGINNGNAKALGLMSGASAGSDGSVGFDSAPGTFAFDPANRAVTGLYDFIGVALHEISEVMGRVAGVTDYSAMDLFRYSAPGVRQFTNGSSAYFSTDAGKTNLDNFNTKPGGDYGDWAASAGHDAALAFSSSGVANLFSQADINVMDAIGWNTVAASVAAPVAPPVAANDLYITRAGTTLAVSGTYGVLANDADPASLGLSTTLGQSTAHGTLAFRSDGSLTYTPQNGFIGTDTFTYRATNTGGQSTGGNASIVVGSTNALTSPEQQIAELYLGYYNRAPDVAGLNFWTGQFTTPGTAGVVNPFFQNLAQASAAFGAPTQAETTALYPFLANPSSATYINVVTFVDTAYSNLFGRTVDGTDQGVRYWSTSISKSLGITVPVFGDTLADTTHAVSAPAALLALIQGALGNDAATIANKVTAGLYYEGQLATSAGAATQTSAHQALAPVTFDSATVLTSEAATNTYVHATLAAGGMGIGVVGLLDSTLHSQLPI